MVWTYFTDIILTSVWALTATLGVSPGAVRNHILLEEFLSNVNTSNVIRF